MRSAVNLLENFGAQKPFELASVLLHEEVGVLPAAFFVKHARPFHVKLEVILVSVALHLHGVELLVNFSPGLFVVYCASFASNNALRF